MSHIVVENEVVEKMVVKIDEAYERLNSMLNTVFDSLTDDEKELLAGAGARFTEVSHELRTLLPADSNDE